MNLLILLFTFIISIFLELCHGECSEGCAICELVQSNYQCINCSPEFQLNSSMKCVYSKCEEYQFFQVRNPNEDSQCVAICDNYNIPNSETNTCNQISQCTQNYISQTAISNNSLLRNILSYQTAFYLILYDGFINFVLRTTGEFQLQLMIDSSIIAVVSHRDTLIAFQSDNSVNIWQAELKVISNISYANVGQLSSSSAIFQVDNNTSCFTSFDIIQKAIYFNLITFPLVQQKVFQYITLKVDESKIIMSDHYIAYQTSRKLQIFIIQKLSREHQLIELTKNMSCYLASSSSIAFSLKYSPKSNLFGVILKDAYSFLEINLVQEKCTTITFEEPLKNLEIFENQNGQNTYLLQFNSYILIKDENQQLLQQIQLLDNTTILSHLIIPKLAFSSTIFLLILNSNSIALSYSLQSGIFQESNSGGLPLKILNPLSFKTIINLDGSISIFVTGQDFQEIFISSNSSLQVKYIVQSFKQTYNSNKSSISRIIFDSNRQKLYSCSSEGKLIAWNILSFFQLQFLTEYSFSNENCRNVEIINGRIAVMVQQFSIYAFDLLNSHQLLIIQKPDESYIKRFTIKQMKNLVYINYDDCLSVIGGDLLMKFTQCNQQLATVFSMEITNNERVFFSGENFVREYQLLYDSQTLYLLKEMFDNQLEIQLFKVIERDQYLIIMYFDNKEKLFYAFDSQFIQIQQNKILNAKICYDVEVSLESSGKFRFFFLHQTNISTQTTKQYIETCLQGDSTSIFIKNFSQGKIFADIKQQINYKGELVYFLFCYQSLTYTSLIITCKWNSVTSLGNFESYDFSREENMTVVTALSVNNIAYVGNTSGFLGITSMVKESNERMYLSSTTETEIIITIKQSYQLGRYFIVKKRLLEFDLYQNSQISEIIFNDDTGEYVKGLNIFHKLRILVCFKSTQLKLKQYPALSNPIEYSIDTFGIIFNYYISERTSRIFIFGSKVSSFDFQLENEINIFNESSFLITTCVFPTGYIICKTLDYTLSIILESDYSNIKTVVVSGIQQGFSLTYDELNGHLFAYMQTIQVYSLSGTFITTLSQPAANLIEFNLYGNFIVLLTTGSGYIYSRSDCSFKISFLSPMGGTLQKSSYLENLNQVLYFNDYIWTGQIFVFSLDLLMELTPIKHTTFTNYKVVNFSYETETGMVFYVDSFGNYMVYVYITGTNTSDSPQTIDEFQNNPPLDFSIDYLSNCVIIFNSSVAYKVNYATLTRTVVRVFQPDHNRYIRRQKGYLIIDSTNILLAYFDYKTMFVTSFEEQVISILQTQDQHIIIVQFRDYLLIFKDLSISSLSIRSDQYSYRLNNFSILIFFTDNIFLTQDLKLIQYDFAEEYLLSNIQLPQDDEIKTYLFLKDLDFILIGTVKGYVLSYSTITYKIYHLITSEFIPVLKFIETKVDIWAIYCDGSLFKITKEPTLAISNRFDLHSISGGGKNNSLNTILIDEVNKRVLISFNFEKRIRILNIGLDPINSAILGFPNTEQNRMQFSESYLLIYTSSQINVFSRNNLVYCFSIRNNSRRQQITEIFVFSEEFFVVSFLKKIDVYFVSRTTFNIQTIDTFSTMFPIIMSGEFSDDKSTLNIIWSSQSNISEKRYSVEVFTKGLLACSSLVDELDSISVLKKLKIIQSSNVSMNQIFYMKLTNNFIIVNGIDQSKTSLVLSPDSLNNSDIDINPQTFLSIKQSAYLKEFNFKFSSEGDYLFSQSTKQIFLQNITISNQNISGIQLLFESKLLVVISTLHINNIQISSRVLLNKNRILESIKNKSNLFQFSSCDRIEIYGLNISDLNLGDSPAALMKFIDIDFVVIKNMTIISNSQFQIILDFENVRNIEINGLIFTGNTRHFVDYLNPSKLILIKGSQQIEISNIEVSNNTSYQFLSLTNQYSSNGETRILENDVLIINNSTFSHNQIENDVKTPDQYELALIDITATDVIFNRVIYTYNSQNIELQQANTLLSKNCLFSFNKALLGGAIHLKNIIKMSSFFSTIFTSNTAKASGGALYCLKVEKIYLDETTLINENKALIGGGVRAMSSSIQLEGLLYIKNNIADIYGDDIALPLKDLTIESQSYEVESFIFTKRESQNQYYGDLRFYQQVSGSTFNFNIAFLDSKGRKVNFVPEKIKNVLYPPMIMNEIENWYVSVESTDLEYLAVTGQSLVSYNQFDAITSDFAFSDLVINTVPGTIQNLILKSPIANVLVSIEFRACQSGEIYKEFQNKIKTCFTCNQGFFSLDQPNYEHTNQQCSKCPSEADICFQNKIVLKKGYWRYSKQSSSAIFCENGELYCDETSAENLNGCIYGHVGPLCEQCDTVGKVWNERFILNDAGECQICSNTAIQYVVIILSTLGLLGYMLIQISVFVLSFQFQQTCQYLRKMNIIPVSVSQLRDQNSFYIKCLMNYLQLQSILVKFSNNFIPKLIVLLPDYFGQPGTKIIIDSICIVSPSLIENFGEGKLKLLISSLVPFFYIFIIISLFQIATYVQRTKSFIKPTFKFTAINFLFIFFQPDAINILTKFLTCRKIGNIEYISEDLPFLCDDPFYVQFQRYYALPLLVCWIIFPLTIFYFLFKRRERLNYCSTIFQFGCYYVEFKKNHYYWEFVKIYLRVSIVIFFTLLKEYGSVTYMVIIAQMSIYQTLLQWKKPYMNSKMMEAEQMSFYTLILIITFKSFQLVSSTPSIFEVLQTFFHYLFILYIIWVIAYYKLFSDKNILGKIFLHLLQRLISPSFFQKLTQHTKVQFQTFILWKKVFRNIKYITTQRALGHISKQNSDPSENFRLLKSTPRITERMTINTQNNNGTVWSPKSSNLLLRESSNQILNSVSPRCDSQIQLSHVLLNVQKQSIYQGTIDTERKFLQEGIFNETLQKHKTLWGQEQNDSDNENSTLQPPEFSEDKPSKVTLSNQIFTVSQMNNQSQR